PVYQKRNDTVAYVETANTSQIKGLRNCGQSVIVFGYGNIQYAYHGRPVCNSGKSPAHATANSVIASAKRLMDVRHSWRNSSRIAEISVPACPIPIHHTKLTMAKPQPTGMSMPQMPTPLTNSQVTENNSSITSTKAMPKPTYHP